MDAHPTSMKKIVLMVLGEKSSIANFQISYQITKSFTALQTYHYYS